MDTLIFVSWNLRGANNTTARFLVRQLVAHTHPAVLCLQETKCLQWNSSMINSLGMGKKVGWKDSPAVGLSGGLLTVWNTDVITVSNSLCTANWLQIQGHCVLDNKELVCTNIYAPQGTLLKKKLWDELLTMKIMLRETYVLLLGD